MSPVQIKNKKQKQRKQIFRKWHRRMGFAASLFLINLAVTGIILNHYEALSLHKKYISSSILLDWYNVKAPSKITCSKSEDSSVCELGNSLYLTIQVDEQKTKIKKLLDNASLVSFVQLNAEYFLITSNLVNIYTNQFELIESIDISEILTDPISKANIIGQTLIIQIADEEYFYSQDTLEFQSILTSNKLINSPLVSSTFILNEPKLIESLSHSYKQQQISVLKFVQDLHSGQLFSLQGKLVTDISGIIIILLAISGFITWQRRKNNP